MLFHPLEVLLKVFSILFKFYSACCEHEYLHTSIWKSYPPLSNENEKLETCLGLTMGYSQGLEILPKLFSIASTATNFTNFT